jgi:type VI secretion system protein ImpK
MTTQIERRAAPSLFSGRPTTPDGTRIHSLLDLMHEGFHLIFLLKTSCTPPAEEVFMPRISAFLNDFDREAKKLRAEGDDIEAAKYAWCAAMDEVLLSSISPLRDTWQRHPLQLTVFGDQLAGEHFFDRLEALRGKGGARLQALQVFHMCLLLGFRGRHAMDSRDRLAYMTARLGDEIAHITGKSSGFAPRAARPDQVMNKLRSDVPLWAVSAVFALVGLGVFTGLRASLQRDTHHAMAAYSDLVKLAPRPASLTITLP